MRHFFLGSVIMGATPLISNIAVATSWLSSLNVSSILPTRSHVCTKVNSQVSETCQQPIISLSNKGKLDIQPYMLKQMTNLVIPRWNVVDRKVRILDSIEQNGVLTKHSQLISPSSLFEFNRNSLALDSSNKVIASSEKPKSLYNEPIKSKNPHFPKFSRSSLLNSSLKQHNCVVKKQDNCASISKLNFAHPAPDTERVASSFGWRRRPYSGQRQFHKGIDYGAPLGSPVVAATDGIVTKVVSGCLDFRNRFCGNQFGNWIEIDHGDGAIALYGHLLHNSIAVKEGMKVWKNQEIARVGSSGWSTGAHLDFRVKVNGKYENPAHFVR